MIGEKMEKMRIIYSEAELKPIIYIILFFRSIGVYVYESTYEEKSDAVQFDNANIDLDLFVCNEEELLSEKIIYQRPKSIFLVNTMDAREETDQFPEARVLCYNSGTSNEVILEKLVEKIANIDERVRLEKDNLLELIEIYDRNHIMEAALATRFYYATEENKYILQKCYGKAIRQIEDKIYHKEQIDRESIYARYAFIYYAYEMDYYCERLRIPYYFKVDSLLEHTFQLKDSSIGSECHSWELLIAQIYGDLSDHKQLACRFYEAAIQSNELNSFAWYKMGDILKKKYKEFARAKRCFDRAVQIDPIYYKAVYKQADCAYEMGRTDEALKKFEHVAEILQGKMNVGILLPMQIEYIFKVYNNIGKIWFRNCNAPLPAISAYKRAERIWMDIDLVEQNQVVKAFLDESREPVTDELYSKMKKKLNIKMVYQKLITLYEVLGDAAQAGYYSEKIMNESI